MRIVKGMFAVYPRVCGGTCDLYAGPQANVGLSPRVRGQEIPNISVIVTFTDYDKLVAKKVRADKPSKNETRKAKSTGAPRPVKADAEPLPDRRDFKRENLGKQIKVRRSEWNLNLTELGQLLDVDRTTVRDWEASRTVPSGTNLKRIISWLAEPVHEKPDPKALRLELGQRIRDKRRSLGMSQRELARYLGAGKNRVYDWEMGKASPRSVNLKRIFEWLDE